jgi:hypothetical protein
VREGFSGTVEQMIASIARRWRIMVLLVGAPLLLGGCFGDAEDPRSPEPLPVGVVATVAGDPITVQELDRRVAAMGAGARNVLLALIQERWLEHEARRRSIAVSLAQVRRQWRAIADRQFRSSRARQRFTQGMSEGEIVRQMRLQALASAIGRRDGQAALLSRIRARTRCAPRYATPACANAPAIEHPRLASDPPLLVNGFVGEQPGGAGGSFIEPTDVAVYRADPEDPDDDKIFVAEGLSTNSRIQRLDGDGNFELVWGKDVARGGTRGDQGRGYEVCEIATACKAAPAGDRPGELRRPTGLAVDPANGDVYVVDSGNARIQRFNVAGRFVAEWGVGGGRESDEDQGDGGAIAIDPRPPHDVFVADTPRNRVLRFRSDGRFVRGWGWGVAGGHGFETCDELSACGAGRVGVADGGDARWPEHLAVDRHGVVYGSVFLGSIFEDDGPRTRIERFAASVQLDGSDAKAALMSPLTIDESDGWDSGGPGAVLTNAATEGLDIDPASGDLVAFGNPFGVSSMDVVRRPGMTGNRAAERPAVAVADSLTFLQNVTGLALPAAGGIVLLSSGTMQPETDKSSFTGCWDQESKADCHGLIVLARGERASAVLTGPGVGNRVAGWIDPNGAATYEFQVSRDGQRWKRASPKRAVLDTNLAPVAADLRSLRRGVAYRARFVVEKRAQAGTVRAVSGVGLVVGGK